MGKLNSSRSAKKAVAKARVQTCHERAGQRGDRKANPPNRCKSRKSRCVARSGPIVLPAGYRPAESEPFMNERHKQYFRNKLVAWKEEIVRQNRETLHVLHEDSAQHADIADRATSETDRALELRARDRQRKLIAKIDAALARDRRRHLWVLRGNRGADRAEAPRGPPDRHAIAGSPGTPRAARESLPRRLKGKKPPAKATSLLFACWLSARRGGRPWRAAPFGGCSRTSAR